MEYAKQIPPFAEVQHLLSREVTRAKYEHVRAGIPMAYWIQDPAKVEADAERTDKIGRGLAKWGVIVPMALGIGMAMMALWAANGHPERKATNVMIAAISFCTGVAIAAALYFWARSVWSGWAKRIRAWGGDTWISSNGSLHGTQGMTWGDVEKLTNRHQTFVTADIEMGPPNNIVITILSTNGPPSQKNWAAAKEIAAIILLGRGGGRAYEELTFKDSIEIPPGREEEAIRVADALNALSMFKDEVEN